MVAIKNATEKRKGSIPYLSFMTTSPIPDDISLLHVVNEFDDHQLD